MPSGLPLRFLHAGDFRLHQPVGGLPHIPEHLHDLLLDAPFQAARRVFDAAEREDVDCVILCGDVIDCRQAGLYGVAFLVEQFERLARRGIEVFLADHYNHGASDWPSEVALPSNVTAFAKDYFERYVIHRSGGPVASVIGVAGSQGHDHRLDAEADAGLFTITVAPRRDGRDRLHNRHVDYWAVSGASHDSSHHPYCHHPGSQQGRSPSETGRHGCTLVEVDGARRAHLRKIDTDVVRFVDETITVSSHCSPSELESRAIHRLETLHNDAPHCTHLVRWTIKADGRHLWSGVDEDDLIGRLRQRQHYHGVGSVWSWRVDLAPHAAGHNADGGSLRNGEPAHVDRYLREVARWHDIGRHDLDHHSEPAVASWREAARVVGHPDRGHVASEAARLGVELLAQEGATL